MTWATVSSRSCFYWLYRASLSLATKNIINLISVLTIWWWPCVELSLGLLEKGIAMISMFSWQNSVNLCLASFRTSRPHLPVIQDISWFPIFEFQSPIIYRTSFLMLVLEGTIGFHRTGQLLWNQRSGHRLWLLWCWMVCLENERRSFCLFQGGTQVLHFRLFCWLWGYSTSSKGFLPHSRYYGRQN